MTIARVTRNEVLIAADVQHETMKSAHHRNQAVDAFGGNTMRTTAWFSPCDAVALEGG
jgi:hypothetical protein